MTIGQDLVIDQNDWSWEFRLGT